MNKFVASLYILLGVSVMSFSQEYRQLIVTDIKHYIIPNTYYGVNKLSFPCYFTDSLFLSDIKDTISVYARQKFAADTVIFVSDPLVSCDEISFAPKTKPILPENPEAGNLYMGISSSISYRIIEFQEVFYQLTSHIYIVDGKNKKRMNKSITLPFMVKPSEGIVSDTLMHRMDFEIFYLDALSAALKAGPGLLEKRFIYQPLTTQYDNYLMNASDYSIERGDTSYSLGKEDGETVPVLNYFSVMPTLIDIKSPAEEQELISQYRITHLNNQDQSDIRFFSHAPDKINILVSGGINSGEFEYNSSGILSGKYSRDSVYIEWKAPSSLSEMKINNKLAGIIHYRTDGQHLYYQHESSPNSLAKIAFLIFLYDEAEFIYQKSTNSNSVYDSSGEGSEYNILY